jgi:hypothetical protein
VKDGGALRLDLGLLSEMEAEMLVERIPGGPVERGARRWISETSRGNALYVRELILGALSGGALEQVSGLWRLPVRPPVSASLTELVAARLAGLDDAQQRALELLALGEPLPLSEVLALTGTDPLAATEARGLVIVSGSGPEAEVRLSHPLYGEVIRASLPSLRGREARLGLARTVQARGSLEPEDTLRVARWLLDAGEAISTDLAAEGSIDTPEAALEYLEQQSEVLHWGLKRPAELRALLDRAAGWWPEREWARRLDPLRLRVASFERLGFSISASTEILATAEMLDAHFDEIPPGLHAAVKQLPGVLETGLFEGYEYEIVD